VSNARPEAAYRDLTLYRRLLSQARPYWPHIGGALLLNLLSAPIALLTPLPLKIAVDSVLGSEPIPGIFEPLFPSSAAPSEAAVLAFVASLVVVVALLRQGQGLASWVLLCYTAERLVLDFRARLFRHLQRLSLSYHDTKGTADSTYRIQYDARSIERFVIQGVIPLLTASLTLAAMLYVTARIDWQLALVPLAVSPVIGCLTHAARRRLRSRWSEVKDSESSALSVVQEVLSSLRVVKAFGQENREEERFVRHSSKAVRGEVYLALVEGGAGFLVALTIALGMAVVLFVGIQHVRAGILTLGDLLLVVGYLSQLYVPLETISNKMTELESGLVSAARSFALLDQVPEVYERPRAKPLLRAQGAVEFSNVTFAYREEHPVLRHISFEIEPSSRVGISGATGAGKSTLLSLLTRFYDPTAGRILLDGVDLRDYRLSDLRNQFAIVLQEPLLFSTTIAENIAYARPDATEQDIVAAARAANAHDFIVALPEGYETQVGERGVRLSGGERQRLSLARAFLKNSPILLLDEPTSAIDFQTEARIIEAVQRLMNGRTAFLIGHRPAMLEFCDVRLHVEHGRLVEARSATTGVPDQRSASQPVSGPSAV
jgi:ATP-binding cassette, subfamily B, bacterial